MCIRDRIGNEQKNYDMILLHSGKLLEYPNNPFAEEALILRAEVQFNQQNMAEALASYKMLKEKATNVERRQLAETGILRCAFLLRDDIETIHAATDVYKRQLSCSVLSFCFCDKIRQ